MQETPGGEDSLEKGQSTNSSIPRLALVAQLVKNPSATRETQVQSLGWEDLLEKGMATHSSILAWRISWTVQSMGSQRVSHDFHFHYTVTLNLCSFVQKLLLIYALHKPVYKSENMSDISKQHCYSCQRHVKSKERKISRMECKIKFENSDHINLYRVLSGKGNLQDKTINIF